MEPLNSTWNPYVVPVQKGRASLGIGTLKNTRRAAARALCNCALIGGLSASLGSGCSTSSPSIEPRTLAIGNLPLFEGTPTDYARNIATPMTKIRAQSCHYPNDRNAAKDEVDASLRRQAVARNASAVVRVKYKEFSYNNRGLCRPGLNAVGTPVILSATP
jgi:hypothetical protein